MGAWWRAPTGVQGGLPPGGFLGQRPKPPEATLPLTLEGRRSKRKDWRSTSGGPQTSARGTRSAAKAASRANP